MAILELFCDECHGLITRKSVQVEPTNPNQLIRARVAHCPCMMGDNLDGPSEPPVDEAETEDKPVRAPKGHNPKKQGR